ncbi:GNAT family N-acetyltransferase [Priestia megaterium]
MNIMFKRKALLFCSCHGKSTSNWNNWFIRLRWKVSCIKKRYEHKTAAEIVKCYVDPAYRRLGIGQQLLKAVEQFAQSHFYDTLYLHTHPFYRGYSILDFTRFYRKAC